jgi:TM2 domain-containing membrane protein YozV/ribosomal protein L37AE/L43A
MRCPYCKEDVLDGAVKCKHCHSSIGTTENRTAAVKTKLSGFVRTTLDVGTKIDENICNTLQERGFEKTAIIAEALAGARVMAIDNVMDKLDMGEHELKNRFSCPTCSQEITDSGALYCSKCGASVEARELQHSTSHSMIWDSEDVYYICVKCPKCSKEAKIKRLAARKTDIGYKLEGEGACSCGLKFDTITKDITNQKHDAAAKQPSKRSTSGILALFLGGFGIHYFYLGRPVAGFISLLFCWTFIPSIFAFFTAIKYFSMTDDNFNGTVDKSHQNFRG